MVLFSFNGHNGFIFAERFSGARLFFLSSRNKRLSVWFLLSNARPACARAMLYVAQLCLDVSACGHEVLTSCKGFGGAGCETKVGEYCRRRTHV